MLELIVLIWGIIAFWGTTWAKVALVLLGIKALVAAYKVGKEEG